MNEEDETVDVEGDSEFDEWAEGQRRRTNPLTIGNNFFLQNFRLKSMLQPVYSWNNTQQ